MMQAPTNTESIHQKLDHGHSPTRHFAHILITSPTAFFTYGRRKKSHPAILNGCRIYSDHAILAVHV